MADLVHNLYDLVTYSWVIRTLEFVKTVWIVNCSHLTPESSRCQSSIKEKLVMFMLGGFFYSKDWVC